MWLFLIFVLATIVLAVTVFTIWNSGSPHYEGAMKFVPSTELHLIASTDKIMGRFSTTKVSRSETYILLSPLHPVNVFLRHLPRFGLIGPPTPVFYFRCLPPALLLS